MRNTLKKLAGLVAGLALAGTLMAQEAQQRLFLDLKDADIVSAVTALSRQTGIQFVVADRDKEFALVTLSLRDATPEEAIKNICLAAGAYAERDASGVYVIRFGKPEDKATAQPVSATTFKQPRETVKIAVRNADPEGIVLQLQGKFDRNTPERPLGAINNGFAPNLNRTPSIITPTSNGVASSSLGGIQKAENQAKGIWMPEDGSDQLSGGAGGPGGGGGAGAGGAGGNAGTELTPGEGLVPDDIDYIGYDPSDNSIIVMGTPSAVGELRRLVELFDVEPRQVEIRVEFITTSQSLAKSFGIEWQLSRGAIFTGTRSGQFIRTGDPIFVNYASGNLSARLRAQLLEGDGTVVNAPMVRTLNNQPASVFQTVTTSIFTPVIASGQGGNIVTYNVNPITINTGLSVRPRINGSGKITMSLAPTVSDFGEIRRAPDGTEVPDQLSQQLQVSTIVRDGETIVLGGLNRTQTSNSVLRFPVLSDIPIIGQLFRRTIQDRNDQELLIFVTPRIIPNDDGFNAGP